MIAAGRPLSRAEPPLDGTHPGTSNAAVLSLPPSASSFTTSGVPPGTYFVRLVATTLVGLGQFSNEITITVP